MRRFLSVALSPGSSDVIYEHAAGIACNCSRLPAGRALLLEGEGGALRALGLALGSRSDVKRAGAAAAVKNVVVAAHQDGTFQKVLQAEGLIAQLLVWRTRSWSLCMQHRQLLLDSAASEQVLGNQRFPICLPSLSMQHALSTCHVLATAGQRSTIHHLHLL
jgi:hypothetical protein